MVTREDREQLAQATELLLHVMERHRDEDLRVVSLFTAAIQDIRVGTKYLSATASTRAS